MKKILAVALMTAASLSFATFAQAEDFPAAPMNHGPMMMTGMGPVGDLFNVGMMPVNVIAQPVMAMDAPAPAPVAAPMMKTHHRRHMKHMTMKKM